MLFFSLNIDFIKNRCCQCAFVININFECFLPFLNLSHAQTSEMSPPSLPTAPLGFSNPNHPHFHPLCCHFKPPNPPHFHSLYCHLKPYTTLRLPNLNPNPNPTWCHIDLPPMPGLRFLETATRLWRRWRSLAPRRYHGGDPKEL